MKQKLKLNLHIVSITILRREGRIYIGNLHHPCKGPISSIVCGAYWNIEKIIII